MVCDVVLSCAWFLALLRIVVPLASLKMKALQLFEMSGIIYPVTQDHNPEDLNSESILSLRKNVARSTLKFSVFYSCASKFGALLILSVL